MKGIFQARLGATLLVLLLAACAPKEELEAERQRSAALQAQLQQEQARAAQLQTEVAELRRKLAALEGSLSAATTQLTRPPVLPVKVALQPVAGESGYAATLSTMVKQDFQVTFSLQSKALGTTRQKRLHLSRDGQTALRFLEGIAFERGDVITVDSPGYEPVVVQVGS